MQADVRRRESVEAFFAKACERFGKPYAVLANAGLEIVETPFADMTEADLDRVVDINVKGTFFTLQQAARSVMDGGGVVATGSVTALYPPPGAGAYAAKKMAMRTMVEVLSLELGPRGVTVNSLNPGPVECASTLWNRRLWASYPSRTIWLALLSFFFPMAHA